MGHSGQAGHSPQADRRDSSTGLRTAVGSDRDAAARVGPAALASEQAAWEPVGSGPRVAAREPFGSALRAAASTRLVRMCWTPE
jgi:hypothetical protein